MDHLLRIYGGETDRLLAYGKGFPNALEKITPGAPDLRAQAYHALREEWAVTAEDDIYRRTSLGRRGFDTPEIRQTISAVIASEAGAGSCRPSLWCSIFRQLSGSTMHARTSNRSRWIKQDEATPSKAGRRSNARAEKNKGFSFLVHLGGAAYSRRV
jgi:C-terminal domain of alpha-glycerophosphate oxidase